MRHTSPQIRLGIDLGGTKIEIIALDSRGDELLRFRMATPQGDYNATLQAIAGLVLQAETALGYQGTIGIGTPGAISRVNGLLKNANSTHLNGKPLKQDMERLLQREVRISNDANCFALSEAVDGAAAGVAVVFGVIIGTGTGAGVVVNGHVLQGPNAIAGEWGHNPLPWPVDDERPGLDCYCGKRGCIETWLSGPGLTRQHARVSGQTLEAPVIAAHALNGDLACERALQLYEDRLARSLAHVINILDPDIIVLGGGMSNMQRLYDTVPAMWGTICVFRPGGYAAGAASLWRFERRARSSLVME